MIEYRSGFVPEQQDVISLYTANNWSSAKTPDRLMAALRGSDHIECAFAGEKLIGLGNAISDGALVVYFPHLLVHPDVQGRGIGRQIMDRMIQRYQGFHQQILLSVNDAAGFYERAGFKKTDSVVPMWIYAGEDH